MAFYLTSLDLQSKVDAMWAYERSILLDIYDRQSPFKCRTENVDGTVLPKPIPEPDIALVPCAEPRVLITDLYEQPEDWYFIRELIKEFATQAYTAYYRGLYYACFTSSISCLEFTLKYEYIRRHPSEHKRLEQNNFTFSAAIKEASKIGLDRYIDRLNRVNEARNGLFHFNPKKLKKSVKQINNELIKPGTKTCSVEITSTRIEAINYENLPESIHDCIDNFEWSKIAYYAYCLMYDITKSLYGDRMKYGYAREALDDYNKRDQDDLER